jgi:hypothetical protein
MTWGFDPGPCPVDDAPHTSCTSAGYTGDIVIPQTPMRDEMAAPPPPVGIPATSPTFSTKTYRRKREPAA